MNISEAVSSGKPFRRPKWFAYVTVKEVEDFSFSAEDLLATDYYVELKKVTITEEDFNKAVARTGNLYYQDQFRWADSLKKELGL